MLLVLSSAGARGAKGSNELTLPKQGDKIFDSSDYNVFLITMFSGALSWVLLGSLRSTTQR